MMNNRNIVLTGFMGTGKSTIGQLVAARLGREFVDMDTLIEQRERRPISRIFAESGEPYFRQLEADLCRELSVPRGLVIATGGGALIPEANLQTMLSGGVVLCLDCQAEELWRRIGQSNNRPLLAEQDEGRFALLSNLLKQRGPAYARIPHHLDVTHLTPEQAAHRVCEIFSSLESSMNTITVTHPNGSYPILIGESLLAQAGQQLANTGFRGRCAVVTNPTVGRHYAGHLLTSLKAAGLNPARIDIPDGEQYKTLDTVAHLYHQLVEAGLDRRSPILALGGGVLGDTAGFAAATYLRGVPLVQIPTTLLAMVDSSVGGKTGVDLPQGKNLVGAFKQPEMVLVDPSVLGTLPAAEFRAGMAEVIKHGIIDAPALFEALEAGQYNQTWMLSEAIQVKVRVVQEDPFEQGRRAVLNLGHTFGHAFERLSAYTIRHGEAVAMGIACAARLAVRLGLCPTGTAERITRLLAQTGLPTEPPPFPPDDVLAAMATDKKRRGRQLRFVLPRGIGNVDIFADIPAAEVQAVLGKG